MAEERDGAARHSSVRRRWLLGLTAAAGALALNAPKVRRMMTVNDVTTGRTPEYPDIQPQVFTAPPEDVFNAAVRAVEDAGWRVVAEDLLERRVLAEVPVPPAFIDDFDVRLTETDAGTRVMVRSQSRVGRGDMGMNARHIRSFQRRLDDMVD